MNKKALNKIILNTKSCENINIPVEQINRLIIDDIVHSKYLSTDNNIIDKYLSNSILIKLSEKIRYTEIDGYSTVGYLNMSGRVTIFDRLVEERNIESITLDYRDGSYEIIEVIYDADTDDDNRYQKICINECNGIDISIMRR